MSKRPRVPLPARHSMKDRVGIQVHWRHPLPGLPPEVISQNSFLPVLSPQVISGNCFLPVLLPYAIPGNCFLPVLSPQVISGNCFVPVLSPHVIPGNCFVPVPLAQASDGQGLSFGYREGGRWPIVVLGPGGELMGDVGDAGVTYGVSVRKPPDQEGTEGHEDARKDWCCPHLGTKQVTSVWLRNYTVYIYNLHCDTL